MWAAFSHYGLLWGKRKCKHVNRMLLQFDFVFLVLIDRQLLRLHVHRKSTRRWPTFDVGRTAFSAMVYMFTIREVGHRILPERTQSSRGA